MHGTVKNAIETRRIFTEYERIIYVLIECRLYFGDKGQNIIRTFRFVSTC
jgi:hypothetical protein